MSLSIPIPQSPATKIAHVDSPLDGVSSSLDTNVNGNGSVFKSPEPNKGLDPGLLDPDAFRRLSLSSTSVLSDGERSGRSASVLSYVRYASRSPAPPRTWRASFQHFSQRNRGLWLVTISQFFGALMNVTTRLLELEGDGMHPFQVLFARMGITMVLCCAYMFYTKVPYFPLGVKEVRWLLVFRGLSGFFGIFGMYYSLLYLPLADATVITFLSPSLAGYGCYILFGEAFTRTEQIASVVSLFGVVLIARPTSFFHLESSSPASPQNPIGRAINATSSDYDFPTPTSGQRLSAVGVSLLGVVGSAIVFTTIRWIGKRAHPLISVNYFAIWCTLVSAVALSTASLLPPPFASPGLKFALPASLRQWAMLFFLGTCGFIMQFMMTAGISHEKSNRATNMVYTNMLFALLFDRWIFGSVPGLWSLLGSGLILGSAIYVAIQKGVGEAPVVRNREVSDMLADEERGMLEESDDGIGVAEVGGEGVQLMEINVGDHEC